jgi:hypothetical protein
MDTNYDILWRDKRNVFNYAHLPLDLATREYANLVMNGARSVRLMCEGREVQAFPERENHRGYLITSKRKSLAN